MAITISKADIIWGYVAIFFNVASGVIILPFILRMLSADEVGFNYLLLTVSQMVSLFDIGFSPMYGKNISYVFSGTTKLQREGLREEESDCINFRLLAILIMIARYVYSFMSAVALLLLLTGGTWYAYRVTSGFTTVPYALWIWLIYSMSTFFNLYFSYYNALLFGSGQVKVVKKCMIISRIIYIVLSIILLYSGCGLIGISIANLLSPFVSRYISVRAFFTKNIKGEISQFKIRYEEIKENFLLMWYNTKKMMISAIGSYCINRASLFIAGFYLTLGQVGSYGLMLQLGGVITGVSSNYFNSIQPKLANYMVKGNWNQIRSDFSFGILLFFWMSIGGFLFMIFVVPLLLQLIQSHTILPAPLILVVYAVVNMLETNHSICSGFIIIGNKVPAIWYALIPGFFIVFLSWIFLKYSNLGIMGLVIAPGICQLVCNNWKWPLEALRLLQMTPQDVLRRGSNRIKMLICSVI